MFPCIFFMFLINTKHKKCVRELSMKIFRFKYTVVININLNVWWSSLWMSRLSSLFLVGFIQVKWLKNFLLLSMQIIIYSNFMKILAMLYFLVMKWIFDESIDEHIDHNNINLDDTNYIEHEHETIIHIRLLVWHIKFEKPKVLKEDLNEKLVLITWYPKKWWNFCMWEDLKKKEIEPILTE